MSGLAGLIDRTQTGPNVSLRAAMMVRALQHRGLLYAPRVNSTLPGGALCFAGSASSANGDNPNLKVLADTRLDNLDALATTLNAPRDVSAVIIAAYKKWDVQFPAHLLGDFAIVLWDAQRRRLLCARDHFGVKPLYHAARGDMFAFASEAKALFALGFGREIEESSVVEFLAGLPRDPRRTSFRDIGRVPPAHVLSRSGGAISLTKYWTLEAAATPRKDAPEQFLEVMSQAVRRRVCTGAQAGALLSGGLDSSFLSCLAARELTKSGGSRLKTVSLVPGDRAGGERPYIDAVVSHIDCDPHFGPLEGASPFTDGRKVIAEQDDLFTAAVLATSQRGYRIAAENGVKVLLDGQGGDEVVSYGAGLLRDMARQGRLLPLWRDIKTVAPHSGQQALPTFLAYLAAYYPPGRKAARLLNRFAPRFIKAGAIGAEIDPFAIIRADLAARNDIQLRAASIGAAGMQSDDEQERHLALLSACPFADAFEVMGRAAAFAGVEPLYPFLDKEVVEFCVSLPVEEKRHNGLGRLVMRRAMAGIAPEMILQRPDKFNFGPTLARDIIQNDMDVVEHVVLGDAYDIGDYVDLRFLRHAYADLATNGENIAGEHLHVLWRSVTLALWLSHIRGIRAPVLGAA